MYNLYDLTRGNYRLERVLSIPDFPSSEIQFSTTVIPQSETEWSTEIEVSGTYDGPTDFIASRGYRLWWTHDGERLLERGIAMLERSSGELVASEWVSTIRVDAQTLTRFPKSGEVARIRVSPFDIDGNSMSYKWNGTVATVSPYPTFDRSGQENTPRNH